jgi:hypothetical protein
MTKPPRIAFRVVRFFLLDFFGVSPIVGFFRCLDLFLRIIEEPDLTHGALYLRTVFEPRLHLIQLT